MLLTRILQKLANRPHDQAGLLNIGLFQSLFPSSLGRLPKGIRKHLKRISGVDLSVVDGFGVSLAQTVIMEVGTDMSKFPSEKQFCSWLGLAPKHEISGGKMLKNKTLKTKNRAGQGSYSVGAEGLEPPTSSM
jgi:hypothetical protein